MREIVDADVEKLLQVRIRRISLFDINKHREEMEKTKAELDETRKNLKGLTKYVIGHLEALLEKYGPQYPRLTTKSARHEEVDVKAVAFKAFKVSYDRESGYVGYKVSGEEFKLECTKFDKILLVFKRRHLQGQRIAGEIVCRAGIVLLRPAGARKSFHLRLHRPQRELSQAVHVRRHDFEQGLFVHPGKIAHFVFRAGHAEAALRPLQARAAPENFAADVRSGAGGSEKSRKTRGPADFHQGHFVRHRRTDARLG